MTKDKYQSLPVFHFSEELTKRHAKKQLKCLIFGNFGAKNQGDEAILAGQIQELQKIPKISITVVSRFPEEIVKLHKVQAISLYSLNKIRRAIRKSDFVIVGGGGLINKVERNIIGFGFQLYMLGVYFYLPRFYRKKLYILGIGIYNNANPLIVSLALPLLKSASLLTVRDYHSYEFLKSKKVMNTLYKDNSFLMDFLPVSQVLADEFFKVRYRKDRQNIGISLLKPESKKDEKHLLQEVLTFMGKHKTNTTFWFYATDVNPSYPNDGDIGKQLTEMAAKEFGDSINLYTLPTSFTPQLLFSSFKLMNFFIAMRFHTAVFAYRSKIPFAGISYDKKCASFIQSVGQKPLSLKNLTWKELEQNR